MLRIRNHCELFKAVVLVVIIGDMTGGTLHNNYSTFSKNESLNRQNSSDKSSNTFLSTSKTGSTVKYSHDLSPTYVNSVIGKRSVISNNSSGHSKELQNHVKKVFEKFRIKIKSPMFAEYLKMNEKCTGIEFNQTLSVDFAEELAIFKHIHGRWECERISIPNRFCFGICQSFRYPTDSLGEHGDYYSKNGYGLPYKIKLVQEGREPRQIVKSTKEITLIDDKGEDSDSELVVESSELIRGYVEKTYEKLLLKPNNTKQSSINPLRKIKRGVSLNRLDGYFCSACVPKSAKYLDFQLKCHFVPPPEPIITNLQRKVASPKFTEFNYAGKKGFHYSNIKQNTHKFMKVFNSNDLVEFLNKYGINPSDGKIYKTTGAMVSQIQRNKTQDIQYSEESGNKSFLLEEEVVEKKTYLLVSKRVLIIDKCGCQSCDIKQKYF